MKKDAQMPVWMEAEQVGMFEYRFLVKRREANDPTKSRVNSWFY